MTLKKSAKRLYYFCNNKKEIQNSTKSSVVFYNLVSYRCVDFNFYWLLWLGIMEVETNISGNNVPTLVIKSVHSVD